MAKSIPQRKIDDCRELYLRYGGVDHARIVAGMRARGWTSFTDRNLYVRTRRGKPEPGWPERFGWDVPAKYVRIRSGSGRVLPARRSGKHGTAYANRQASERTVIRPAALEVPKEKYNHQKARRLRRQRDRRIAGNAGAPACMDAASAGRRNTDIHAHHAGGTGVADEGVGVPGTTDSPDFHSWLKTMPSIWSWDARHQLHLYEHLQKVTDGTVKRLMIFMPPRHGKSELVTVRYTAWRLRQDPSLNVIIGSYAQDLANRFSRKIKKVLIDDWEVTSGGVEEPGSEGDGEKVGTGIGEKGIRQEGHSSSRIPASPSLPFSPSPDSSPFPFTRSRLANRASEWETTMGGGLRAVGVGAGVTGYGASLIVIDDPVKSREQANSRRFRDKVWDWYNDDLRTRLEPDGTIILIQTRWHQDDLAGRLLAQEDGEQWTIVNMPALAEGEDWRSEGVKELDSGGESDEIRDASTPLFLNSSASHIPVDALNRKPGEALWPERFDTDALEGIRRRQGDFMFASLYQQRPVPQEGGLFKREWFEHIVERAPDGLEWKRGYDLAISLEQTADYTASFRVAYDADGYLYIDGGIRRRIGFPEQKRLILDLIRRERDTQHGIEKALHGNALMQDLRREARTRGRRFIGVDVRKDKHTRALKWQTLAADGRIRLVRGPWNRDFLDEICTFPNARHDDQLDAVSLAVEMHEKKAGKLYVF